MLYGLNEETLQSLINIFKSYPQISRVILYGSRAKGNYRKGSDIDFTLYGEGLTSELMYQVDERIDELYLPYKVDISVFNHLDNKDLIEHINRVGKVFYRR